MNHVWFKKAYVLIGLLVLCTIIVSCKREVQEENISAVQSLEKLYNAHLLACYKYLDSITLSENIEVIKRHYLLARKHFKMAEPVLAFMDSENYKFLNQPNITRVDEEDFTDVKIKDPKGFQVLEENIFIDVPDIGNIHKIAAITANRIGVIQKNTTLAFIKDYHFLWMFREAVIRVALTGITGFDSPVLENSLGEGQYVYEALIEYLEAYRLHFNSDKLYKTALTELNASINSLNGNFNDFNRYDFIKNHTHPTLVLWTQIVSDWNVKFPFEKAIRNNATSLFSNNTFNMSYFSSESFDTLDPEKVKLGKRLFYENKLSANGEMSCASCHQPGKQFTDGRKTAIGNTRNSPTLLYATLQKGFFYDNRAGSLEGQIVSVVNNENEFHSNLENLQKVVSEDDKYVSLFGTLYTKDAVTEANIRNAIATYIRSLTPFNSKFDKNINGLENGLTASEKNGFNLFMGKAKCATCHFAPVFNGTVPVVFKDTEVELIGVPETKDTVNAKISADLGRYHVFNTKERKHFFKTPTVRNIEYTGPYMHNGVYETLEEVIDFYNCGGGAGIGIEMENQTLPPDPLNLTAQENKDLVAFMKALSDPVPSL